MLFRFSRNWKVKTYLFAVIVLWVCMLPILFIPISELIILKIGIGLILGLFNMWTFIMVGSNLYYRKKLRGEIFMSEESEYLNYSQGLCLQNLCKKVKKEIDTSQNFTDIINFINFEKRNLRKNQSNLWQCTISTLCYYKYLNKIENALKNNCITEKIEIFSKEIRSITRTKIYVLFLAQEPSCWPSIESVFYAAKKNPDYETALVYTPFFHKDFFKQQDYYDFYVNEMKLPILRHNEYNLPKYSPDVIFMIKPYGNVPEQFQIKHLQCVIPRVVYIPYGMELTTDLAKFGFQYYLHYKAWKHCAYGSIVKEYAKKYGYRNGENIAVWGHPKADHYIDLVKNRENIPKEWKKIINGRKTILWTPHHLIKLDENGTGTWLIWGEKILELIQKNPDVVFIFRPHPLMLGALINNNFMTEKEVEELQRKIENIPNIIWDTNATYYNAFDAADAIIADGTTFSLEFLYTKKPILLTPRNMSAFYQYKDMLESYYIVNSEKDIENFIEIIRKGKDPLYKKRMELYDKTFFVPETGTVGENIMKNVKKVLTEECQEIEEEIGKNTEKNLSITNTIEENILSFKESREEKLPLISILVLCYKNQKLLYGMLDTIFQQDYPKMELIVSDDGSEDFDKDEIISYIQNKKSCNFVNTMVLQNEQNMGTVKHIDKVLKLVKGDYIILTAADDRFVGTDVMSSYVEEFVSNTEAMWIVARCDLTSPDYKKKVYTTPTEVDKLYFKEGDVRKLFSRWSRRGIAVPCCMMFRREVFELVGGIDLQYKYLEDYPIILKLLRKGYAPLFLDKVIALHSMGGISNSNNRYGVETRKAFYEDKYLLYEKEVEPYKTMMFPEDKKAYKQYRKEILERHYFFFIDYKTKTKRQLFWHMLKKPIRFWWLFENKYMNKMNGKIPRRKMIFTSHILLLFAFFFLQFKGMYKIELLFYALGIMDIIVAVPILFGSITTIFLEKHFKKKDHLRKELVN